jgi:hypothetical protein
MWAAPIEIDGSRLGEIGRAPNNSIMFLIESCQVDWSFGEPGSVKTVLRLRSVETLAR